MNDKVYSLGAVMRYLEKQYGAILDMDEEDALEYELDLHQEAIDKIEELQNARP